MLKIKSKTPTPPPIEEEVVEEQPLEIKVYMDYIGEEGYVYKYNKEKGKYYKSSICLMGPKGNPGIRGPKGDPGAGADVDLSRYATKNYVDGKIDELIGLAEGETIPQALDTIKEISDEVGRLQGIILSFDGIDSLNNYMPLHGNTGDVDGFKLIYLNGDTEGIPIDISLLYAIYNDDSFMGKNSIIMSTASEEGGGMLLINNLTCLIGSNTSNIGCIGDDIRITTKNGNFVKIYSKNSLSRYPDEPEEGVEIEPYTILDTGNAKTINNVSLLGPGNIDVYTKEESNSTFATKTDLSNYIAKSGNNIVTGTLNFTTDSANAIKLNGNNALTKSSNTISLGNTTDSTNINSSAPITRTTIVDNNPTTYTVLDSGNTKTINGGESLNGSGDLGYTIKKLELPMEVFMPASQQSEILYNYSVDTLKTATIENINTRLTELNKEPITASNFNNANQIILKYNDDNYPETIIFNENIINSSNKMFLTKLDMSMMEGDALVHMGIGTGMFGHLYLNNDTIYFIISSVRIHPTTYDIFKARLSDPPFGLLTGALYLMTDYQTTTMLDDTRYSETNKLRGVSSIVVSTLLFRYPDYKGILMSEQICEVQYNPENIYWSAVAGEYFYSDSLNMWFKKEEGTVTIDTKTYIKWTTSTPFGDNYTQVVTEDSNEGSYFHVYNGTRITSTNYGTIGKTKTVEADGKGTITWMKDSNGNEAGYDFLHIQFKRYKDTTTKYDSLSGSSSAWCYTFSNGSDGNNQTEASSYCYNNIIERSNVLPNNVIYATKNGAHNNHISGKNNTFMEDCSDNELKHNSSNNFFGLNCSSNELYNSSNNNFGNNCSKNILKQNNSYNTFGNSCVSNTLFQDCNHNQFSNYNSYNILETKCSYIKFPKNYTQLIKSEQGNQYIELLITAGASEPTESSPLKNITFAQGLNNSANLKTIYHNPITGDPGQVTYQSASSQIITV